MKKNLKSIRKKSIDLIDIPESKKLIDSMLLCDRKTKETGLEHGFKFCKKDNEIIIDKMCVGTDCKLEFVSEKCDIKENSFHIHPRRDTSEFSIADLYNSIRNVYYSDKSIISCIKGENTKDVLCEEIYRQNDATYYDNAYKINEKYRNSRNINLQDELRKQIYDKTNYSKIKFNLEEAKQNIDKK